MLLWKINTVVLLLLFMLQNDVYRAASNRSKEWTSYSLAAVAWH